MKRTFLNLKSVIAFLVILFSFSATTLSQTPQYYNLNNGTSSNSFPFNVTGGKAVNSLFLAGEFNQPSPIPPGQQITKVYFRTSTTGTRTYTNLHILMAQSTITTLTTGQFYPGPWDTVYFNASATLSSVASGWMQVTLDDPFPYDPTRSLVLFVGQCGATGTAGSVYNSTLSDIRRTWSVGGCPFVPYASGDASMLNFGVDVVPAAQLHQPDKWCANFPPIPGSGVIWGHASVAYGDTVYLHGDGGATATTMFRKYSISGNTWTTGTPLPGPKSSGDLVACGSKIYYVGGGSAYNIGDAPQYVYNPATGTWTTIAPIPTPVTGCVGESYQDSIIYVICGGWSSYLTTVQVYRVNSNTWTTATSLPGGTGRRSFAGGLWGNKIFVCAGYSGTFRQDLQIGTINPANPLLITWAAGPNFAVATSRPGGTAIADRFYIVVGEISGGYGNQMGRFDIATNTWLTAITPKPTPTSNLWGCVSGSYVNCSGRLGIKIWVPGGSQNTGRQFDVFSDTCLTGCQAIIVSAQNNNNQIPKTYALKQNYPNPFNPSTKISYQLPKASDVKIFIFDVLGREVAVLVNEFKPAGIHSVEFNAVNLASGVYLYRIEAGDFRDTKKMMFVK